MFKIETTICEKPYYELVVWPYKYLVITVNLDEVIVNIHSGNLHDNQFILALQKFQVVRSYQLI